MFLVLKTFKTKFKKEKNTITTRNKFIEPNKFILSRWVDKALNQLMTKQNIKAWFKVAIIWHLKPKVMDNKIKPSSIYTSRIVKSKSESENDYTSNGQVVPS
jgi:hypothetical protein